MAKFSKNIFLFIVTIVFSGELLFAKASTDTFGPILSGEWYPQDAGVLKRLIGSYLDDASKNFFVQVTPDSIRAIVMPHAGYAYSAFCAACACAPLREKKGDLLVKNQRIKRVVLLAPSHAQSFSHVSLPDFSTYKTALGSIAIDERSISKLSKNRYFKRSNNAFLLEHAVEVELPFLQSVIADFKLIPLIVGNILPQSFDAIVQQIRTVVDDKTLVVVSSDFIHYGKVYGYQPFTDHYIDMVRQLDSQLLHAIETGIPASFNSVIEQTGATVCGRDPISILLALFRDQFLEVRLACYYASPQMDYARTANEINTDRFFDSVSDAKAANGVSYMGLIFTTDKRAKKPVSERLTGYEQRALIALARRSISNFFAGKKDAEEFSYPLVSSALSVHAGAFVTLKTSKGDLRGCIGVVETSDPLYLTVARTAQSAAFQDSRFLPLTVEEFADVKVDITVLEPPVSVPSWKDIVIGKHGVILKNGARSALFLPQVAPEQGWDLPTMLSQLSLKAGLPASSWRDPKTTFKIFEGYEISEN